MSPRRAFTIVELMVVISIITLLVAMLMPSFRMMRENARRGICAGHIRQNLEACTAYSNDNRSNLPVTGHGFGGAGYWWEKIAADEFVNHYLGSNYETLFCPSALTSGMTYYPSLPAKPTAKWWWIDWNTMAGSTHRVMGYETTIHRTAAMPLQYRVRKITDSNTRVVWADGLELGPGGPPGSPWSWRVAHNNSTVNPDGANNGFLDCSVRWNGWDTMAFRWQNGGWQVWW